MGTSGKVTIRAEARAAMAMDAGDMGAQPPPPGPEAGGCATATITPGTLTKATVSLMNPPPPPC